MAGSYLRCALVWERMMIDERVFAPPARITVGESSSATFTLQSSEMGSKQLLFEHGRGGTTLVVRPGMQGRVKVSGQVRETQDLLNAEGFVQRNGDGVRYPLTENDGGVLVFGRVGLMFQFVQDLGKVEPARLNQIAGTDSFMNRIFVFAVAILLLFAAVSRLFAQSPSAFTVEQLPDRIVSYVVEDPESALDFQQEMERRREEQKKVKETPPADTKKPVENTPNHKKPARDDVDQETEKIREKVAGKGVVGAIQVAKQKSGALKQLLEDGGLGMSLNDSLQMLNRGASARVLTSEGGSGPLTDRGLLARAGSAEAMGEGMKGAGPATGQTGRRVAEGSRLAERREATVVVSIPSDDAQVTGGVLDKKDIFDVVQKNKGAIRYCYESQLLRFPTLRGQVVVDFIIETNGTVQTVKVPNNSLSQAEAKEPVAGCLIKFIKRWIFKKPQGGKVRVIYPFTYGRTQ